MSHHLHAPGMDLTHPSGELLCEVMARKMDIEQRGGRVAMARKLGNLMQLPAR